MIKGPGFSCVSHLPSSCTLGSFQSKPCFSLEHKLADTIPGITGRNNIQQKSSLFFLCVSLCRWTEFCHMRKFFGMTNMFVIWLWWFHNCMHVSKPNKLHTINVSNLVYDSYTSVKLFWNYLQGVPFVAQQKQIWLVSMRVQVRSLALLSRSGILCCCELWCRSQMRFRSHVTVSVV